MATCSISIIVPDVAFNAFAVKSLEKLCRKMFIRAYVFAR